MPGCSAPSMMGGRKRRGGRSRKMKGGNFYGMGEPIGTGIPTWNAVANAGATPSGGVLPEPGALTGGRRRRGRTGKKATRKGRKHSRRRRTMRGGAGVVNSAGVGYGFTGAGAGGLADATGYASRVGGAPMGADMVRQA